MTAILYGDTYLVFADAPCIRTTVSSHLDTGGMENVILESKCSTATIEVNPKSSCASSITGIVVELQ